MYRIAAIQMASGSQINANLQETARLINEAANMGAKLVVLPENFALMAINPIDNVKNREKMGKGIIQNFLAEQAIKSDIWIVGGTLPLETENPLKCRAACLLFDNTGKRIARYDKIHLFDVTATKDEYYCESKTIEAGQKIVVVDTPYGNLGLSICYDLRFPELYRCMLEQDVEIFCIPAAFTAVTGKVHWETLIRTRAIENLCYIVAANQGGYHVNGRETHGHSMIVDSWGSVLTSLNRGAGVICTDIDFDKQRLLRNSFPAPKHRKIQCHCSNIT
ncbi:MAG: carbon-nitrogen hydrolase family protein [Thiomargarita sp.]|nr:carbon-nitrogen hydrolase family protein [Thiomargarita sp.]